MDEATKERFKLKFYILAVIINLIVLLVAGAVFIYFKAPTNLNEVLALALAAIAVVLAYFFVRRYRATKAWLDEHT